MNLEPGERLADGLLDSRRSESNFIEASAISLSRVRESRSITLPSATIDLTDASEPYFRMTPAASGAERFP